MVSASGGTRGEKRGLGMKSGAAQERDVVSTKSRGPEGEGRSTRYNLAITRCGKSRSAGRRMHCWRRVAGARWRGRFAGRSRYATP